MGVRPTPQLVLWPATAQGAVRAARRRCGGHPRASRSTPRCADRPPGRRGDVAGRPGSPRRRAAGVPRSARAGPRPAAKPPPRRRGTGHPAAALLPAAPGRVPGHRPHPDRTGRPHRRRRVRRRRGLGRRAGPGRRLFVVGDPKQSIYRFRRADIATYLARPGAPRHTRRPRAPTSAPARRSWTGSTTSSASSSRPAPTRSRRTVRCARTARPHRAAHRCWCSASTRTPTALRPTRSAAREAADVATAVQHRSRRGVAGRRQSTAAGAPCGCPTSRC